MTTVLNREAIQVKRDLQRRVENWVAEYCNALEENFKQHSINSYKRNIQEQRFPENTKYYEERLAEIENGTYKDLYKFTFKTGKKFHKVYFLQYEEAS